MLYDTSTILAAFACALALGFQRYVASLATSREDVARARTIAIVGSNQFSYVLNYGNSDFDARHRLAASYVYDLPGIGKGVMRSVLADWQLAGITVLQTGFPFEIYQRTQRSLWCDGYSDFGCPDVPEMTGFKFAKPNPRSNPQYFDGSYFSSEVLGTFGNTPRNFLHGPGFNYTNLQVTKNVYFGVERHEWLELRLEAFNAFNHANFANPSGNFNSGSFGQITSVVHSADPNGDPSPGRAIQLASRFHF